MLEIWAYKGIDFAPFFFYLAPHSHIALYCGSYLKIVHSGLRSLSLEAVFDSAKEAVVVTDISESCKIAGLIEYNPACYFNRIGNIVFG